MSQVLLVNLKYNSLLINETSDLTVFISCF